METILFTGDATGTTLDVILGDVKNEDPSISKINLKNRDILRKKMHFSIRPYHGLEKRRISL